MKMELKTPKKGATQRLRNLYEKLRNETRRPEENRENKPSQPKKKIAQPTNDSDLEM
jgi:hypothetical protein